MLNNIATRTLLSSFVFLLLVSCTSPTPASLPPTETFPSLPTMSASPTDTPRPEETQTPFPMPAPELERPQYVMDLQLNFSTKAANVNQTIVYPNWSGETLTSLVLAVQPNLWNGGFSLKSLAADDVPITNYTIENLNQRLEIQLIQPLPPGGTVTITMNYGLVLPQLQAYSNPNEIRPQIYGFSERQTNFVDWYPFIVPYVPGKGWILHNPWYYGEHLVYDAADFDVTVTFTDGSEPRIASSGAEVSSGTANNRRFVLEAGRTFALSMSLYYKVGSQKVGDVTVLAYYFAFYDEAGQAMLRTTVEAMEVFNERFGPYPHRTMTAVQGDFNDGMEYSAFYFISRDYFNLYDGTPKNYLIIISAHETAHQWWFEGVANNQALEPWLDETLATYSERLYYESVYPDNVDWWWDYRYFEFQKPGFVDTPIYEGGGQRPYWDKTYLTGARFLEELRQRVGDDIFLPFLKDYYNQYVGGRATTADFFRVFRKHTATDISDLMAKYFQKTY
jgi:hypothetical protein